MNVFDRYLYMYSMSQVEPKSRDIPISKLYVQGQHHILTWNDYIRHFGNEYTGRLKFNTVQYWYIYAQLAGTTY